MLSRTPLSLVLLLTLTLGAVLAPPAAHAASEGVKDLEQLLSTIAHGKQLIADLDKRLDSAEGFIEKALRSRLIKARVTLLEQNLEYVSTVADAEEAGNKNDKHHNRAIEILESQLQAIKTTAAIIRERIVPPEAELPATQRAAAYSKIFQLIDLLNHGYEIYIDSIKLAQRFDMDVSAELDRLKMDLRERAENGSV